MIPARDHAGQRLLERKRVVDEKTPRFICLLAQDNRGASVNRHRIAAVRIVAWRRFRVFPARTLPARHVLAVRGEKPYSNMEVKLNPLVYIRQPEYWGIEGVGCLPEVGLPVLADYVVKLEIDGTIGTRGIDVIAANRSEALAICQARRSQHIREPARW
jgi:hypothetical protein